MDRGPPLPPPAVHLTCTEDARQRSVRSVVPSTPTLKEPSCLRPLRLRPPSARCFEQWASNVFEDFLMSISRSNDGFYDGFYDSPARKPWCHSCPPHPLVRVMRRSLVANGPIYRNGSESDPLVPTSSSPGSAMPSKDPLLFLPTTIFGSALSSVRAARALLVHASLGELVWAALLVLATLAGALVGTIEKRVEKRVEMRGSTRHLVA